MWQEFLATTFGSNGWTRVAVAAGVYYEPRLDVTCAIHGDDFLAEGEMETLAVLDSQLEAAMDVKILAKVGPGGVQSGKYLKTTIEWDGVAFGWRPDGKHVARLIDMLGLSSAKPADTPGTRGTAMSTRDALDPLIGEDLALFPRAAGLLNYIAVDRPDIQYSLKNVLQDVHSPCRRSLMRIKRIGRYLIDRPGILWRYPIQETPTRVMYQSDSDWGDDKEHRKSTTCIFGYFGAHLLETQVANQAVIALSSGEAEFYAMGRAAASAIMMKQVLFQCRFPNMEAVVQSDSSAARGIASRIGSGKLRHLQIRDLWIQEKTRNGEIKLEKQKSEDNTSDLGTKYLDRKRIDKLIAMACLVFEVVQPAGAKGLAAVIISGGPVVAAGAASRGRGTPEGEDDFGFCVYLVAAIVGMITIIVWCGRLVRTAGISVRAIAPSTESAGTRRSAGLAAVARAAGRAARRTF